MKKGGKCESRETGYEATAMIQMRANGNLEQVVVMEVFRSSQIFNILRLNFVEFA